MFLSLAFYSLLTASLALFVQYTLEPGEIFGRYGLLLTWGWIKGNHKTFLLGQHNEVTRRKWWSYLLKPLGMCVFCNGAWIAIIAYFVVVIPEGSEITGFRPAITAIIGLFLFLGANYIWTKILSKITE